ncbi:MAG TPA: dihydrofolate reductase family protein [Thermomicrobiales bacterium]|nr:dihydrofolate reductase family protein [Thermomicrobiales bacterium]
MQRLYPDPASGLAPTTIYDDLRATLPPPPPHRPYLMLNMVSSVDGKTVVGGTVSALGSDVDHALMRALRAASDAVLNGAGTVRAERVSSQVDDARAAARAAAGLPAQPLAVVVTRSGDLPLDRRYFHDEAMARVIVAGAAAAEDPERRAALEASARLLVARTPDPDLGWALRVLREEHGVGYLLCEGGPHLNGELFRHGLVDEVFWTVAPKIVGGGEDLTLVEGPPLDGLPRLALVTAYLHEHELFLRYRAMSDERRATSGVASDE